MGLHLVALQIAVAAHKFFMFPVHRCRRLRNNKAIRRMLRETYLSPDCFIYPLFVISGKGIKNPISSMPNCYQESVDQIIKSAKEIHDLNIPAIIIFGIPEYKDEKASSAYKKDGVVQIAIKAIKDNVPELVVITDLCLCEYMSHGHCGIVEGGKIDNDKTIDLLSKIAISYAEAGADIIAPSDMMDGRVKAIRSALDS
ncbi:MAG: porphobilinogen synthase, partial [Thermodesulfovibrionales bacterium]|nr:porphobilinogen synthase [Thermodesulfovibrionales bacterium]